ncbi:hypothetical protein HDU84_007926 [Entophlyctis sp. JEL0112]|nr:hypothetical protein HDU84_007926 [Entophlyctis sp. JEL0112]
MNFDQRQQQFMHPSRMALGSGSVPQPLASQIPMALSVPMQMIPPAPQVVQVSTLDKMDLSGGAPYPEGYVPSVAKKDGKKDKEKKAGLALPPRPLFGSSSLTTYGLPRNKANTAASSANGAKKKKILRVAGGEAWEDDTLQFWDPNDFRLFCGDLGNEVNDELLTRTFSKYPSFLKARVVRDKRTSKTKGYGFVSFKDPNDFVAALREMDGE